MKYYILFALSYFSLAQDIYTINLIIENESEKSVTFNSTFSKHNSRHTCKKQSICTFTWKHDIPFHVNIEKIRCGGKPCTSNDPNIRYIKLHSRLTAQNGTLTISKPEGNIAYKETIDSEMQHLT